MSALDKHTQVYDPKIGKWTTKEQYKRERDLCCADIFQEQPLTFMDCLKDGFPSPYNLRGLPKVDLERLERAKLSMGLKRDKPIGVVGLNVWNLIHGNTPGQESVKERDKS